MVIVLNKYKYFSAGTDQFAIMLITKFSTFV